MILSVAVVLFDSLSIVFVYYSSWEFVQFKILMLVSFLFFILSFYFEFAFLIILVDFGLSVFFFCIFLFVCVFNWHNKF